MGHFAATAADSWITSLHWALGLLTAGLFALHFRNRGRSGPIAALLFVHVRTGARRRTHVDMVGRQQQSGSLKR